MNRDRGHPSALMNGIVNPMLARVLRSRAGAVLGRRLAVVGYVGRHSGRPHELVVQYRRAGSSVLILVGRPDCKQWWHDFTSVRPVTLRLAGRDYATSAHAVRNGNLVSVTAGVAGAGEEARARSLPVPLTST